MAVDDNNESENEENEDVDEESNSKENIENENLNEEKTKTPICSGALTAVTYGLSK